MTSQQQPQQQQQPHHRKTSIHDARIAGLYDLEHTIGKGHFAVVKLARHVFTGEKVAVKVIDKTKLDQISQSHMMQEVRCMKLVQHPNIVRLYEVIDTSTKLFLILELGDYDMYDFIMRNDRKGVSEADAQQYFCQIIKAIDYCHTLHVVHRDLKPENVVFFEKLGMVKLTDFGFSNLFEPGEQLSTSCGSLAYSAPEILLGDAYDAPAVDVWSLGVILYMLVCGRLPFQETNESETLTKILDCRYNVPDHISAPCRDLISRMLVRDPTKRATLGEILASSWVMAGDLGHAEALPLIVRDRLPVTAHDTIIDQMVAGNIATEDQILHAIEADLYNYVSATYYLLAERVLANYREEQAGKLLSNHCPTCECEDDSRQASTSTPSGSQQMPGSTRSRSNSWRGSTSANRRACTILKEESEEELTSYLRTSSRQSSRFFKESPISSSNGSALFRQEYSRPSLVGSRASSTESFAHSGPNPTIFELEESPPLSVAFTDAVAARLEHELSVGASTSASADAPALILSPIDERRPAAAQGLVRPSSLAFRRRNIKSASVEADYPTDDDDETTPGEKSANKTIREKLPRTPSAPMSYYSMMAKRRFLRRNSSPSFHMFAAHSVSSLRASRDRISPQAIQDLLEFSRLSGEMRRAASPEGSRVSSRSPSPESSGRTSPAITSSRFFRIKSTNQTLSASSGGGMRKLSSSPHLLGICEESEDAVGSSDHLKPCLPTQRSVSTIPSSVSKAAGGSLTRSGRSISVGYSSTPRFSASPSGDTASGTTYSSVRIIRPRQAVVSPDMAHRYEKHQKFVNRSRRSTSGSSSETSDDDTAERRHSLIIATSKYCKRNSDDRGGGSDDDPSSSSGGGGGTTATGGPAPATGAGAASSSGPRRSNSMKGQTIPEEPTTAARTGTTAECRSSSSMANSRSFDSTPLQPILEHTKSDASRSEDHPPSSPSLSYTGADECMTATTITITSTTSSVFSSAPSSEATKHRSFSQEPTDNISVNSSQTTDSGCPLEREGGGRSRLRTKARSWFSMFTSTLFGHHSASTTPSSISHHNQMVH